MATQAMNDVLHGLLRMSLSVVLDAALDYLFWITS
jgi:hypothetical protein